MAISVEYSEMAGFPKETRERFRFVATRKLLCGWTNRHTLMAEILLWPGQVYPYKADLLAYASSASVEPMLGKQDGTADPLAAYDMAIVTVRYETASANTPQSVRSASISSLAPIKFTEMFEPSMEFMTLSAGRFRWGREGDDLDEQEAPGAQIKGWDYVLTVLNGSFLPRAAKLLRGSVNAGRVQTRLALEWFGAEELLYDGPVVTRTTEVGQPENRLHIVHRFHHRQYPGWNRFLRSATGKFERLWSKDEDAEYELYPTGNFGEITFG